MITEIADGKYTYKRLPTTDCHPERQPKGLPEASTALARDSSSYSEFDSGRSFDSIRPLADSAQEDSR